MKRAVQSILTAAFLASASSAQANLIRNGGFEEGTFGDGSVREVSRGDTALPGWTVNDNPLAWYTTGYVPNPLNPIGVGPHSGGLAINLCDGSVAVLCDGSVQFLFEQVDPRVVRKLVTRAEGSLVTASEYE